MRLSVVIPTCDRADTLRACLRCLDTGQTLPRAQFELIVADDSRGQPAAGILQDEFPNVTWVEGPRRGPAANRNSGAAHATGDILVFLDDDCLPQPGLLAAYAADFSDGKLLAAEGRIIADRKIARMDEEAPTNDAGGCFWSCNIAMRRDFFERVGRFDERFPHAAMEDVELRERILRHGAEIRFIREALVVHPLRRTRGWTNLRRQAEAHGIYIRMDTCPFPPPSYLAALWHTLRLIRRRFLPRLLKTGGKGAWGYSRTLVLPVWSVWHMKKALRAVARTGRPQS